MTVSTSIENFIKVSAHFLYKNVFHDFREISVFCHGRLYNTSSTSDFIWPVLPPYMGVIPNPKMTFIFPISCILVLIFPIFMTYFGITIESVRHNLFGSLGECA